MSVETTIRCDGATPGGKPCTAVHKIPQGSRRSVRAPKGWMQTRATSDGKRRPRRDLCPACSQRKLDADAAAARAARRTP